ncbi:hypothetical protein MNB_SV-8-1005 [hydrothermal vent metagenome]|uniref:Uncharacterized protein n=1 Tax=hydrothermal vent metagenome TaxID=652676 RepID=A0A1W1BW89_9ZZZZ
MKRLSLETLQNKIITYQVIVMLSFVFGVLGFMYNNWRYEHNENNNNIRIASFQILKELSTLEQIIYANHYDHDSIKGSPRDGWVKVGLIGDLSLFISPECEEASKELTMLWKKSWNKIHTDDKITNRLIEKIDKVKSVTRNVLKILY